MTRPRSAYATDPNGPYRYYYSQLLTKLQRGGRVDRCSRRDRDQPDEEVTLDAVCDKLVILGLAQSASPTRSWRSARRSAISARCCYAGKDWNDPALGRRSMTLLAEKVLPAVNAAIRRTASE